VFYGIAWDQCPPSSQLVGSASQLLLQYHPCNRFPPRISFSGSPSPFWFDNGDKLHGISFQHPDFYMVGYEGTPTCYSR
jgi:hypothetical protein